MNNKRLIPLLLAALISTGAAPACAAVSSMSAPGTRAVPVIPNESAAKENKAARISNKTNTSAKADASVSAYVTPEFDRTLQSEAALTWVMGVLGAHPDFMPKAAEFFTAGSERTKFLAVRELVFPATAWSVAQGHIKSVSATSKGAAVTLSCPDVSKLIDKNTRWAAAEFPTLQKESQRAIAEWRTMGQLRDQKQLSKISVTDSVKEAPVNVYGKLALGPELTEKLLKAPEAIAAEAVRACLKEDCKARYPWAAPYIEELRFLEKYAPDLAFSAELREALKGR